MSNVLDGATAVSAAAYRRRRTHETHMFVILDLFQYPEPFEA